MEHHRGWPMQLIPWRRRLVDEMNTDKCLEQPNKIQNGVVRQHAPRQSITEAPVVSVENS